MKDFIALVGCGSLISLFGLVCIIVMVSGPLIDDAQAGEADPSAARYALTVEVIFVADRQDMMPNVYPVVSGFGTGAQSSTMPVCHSDWHHRDCGTTGDWRSEVLVIDGMRSIHVELRNWPLGTERFGGNFALGPQLHNGFTRRIDGGTLSVRSLGFRRL